MKKLKSIISFSCPRCSKGKLFTHPSSYRKGMAEMNLSCANCGLNFKREPGFYYGAAYVSYALTVALWVAWLVALMVFDAIGFVHFAIRDHAIFYLVSGVILLLLLLPLIYRISRAIWIHLFVSDKAS